MFSFGFVNSYTFDYDYSVYNPLFITNNNVEYLEPSVLFNDGVIDMWIGRYSNVTGNRFFQYMNSTNGINFTAPINLTGFEIDGQGYGLGNVIKISNTYYMLAVNTSTAENLMELYLFSSTDKINWTLACPNAITSGGYKKNPAFYYNADDNYFEGLFEEGAGFFHTYYWYSSSDYCNTWYKGDLAFGDFAGNPDIIQSGGEFVVYYGDMSISPLDMAISVAKSNKLYNLSIVGTKVINSEVGYWAGSLVSDGDIVLTPSGFPYKFYIYFISWSDIYGLRLNVAFDNLNRSFEEVNNLYNVTNYSILSSSNSTFINTITNGLGSLFPDSNFLTTKQKVSYILIFSILLVILLFVLGFTIFKSIPTGWIWLILFLEFLLFIFFVSIGYISLFVLIVFLAIILAILFLVKGKGG